MTFSDEVLMAYADGELDAGTREQVQDAINKDPEIARRVASHQALRDALRSGFDPVLGERVPDRLIAAARSRAPERAAAPAPVESKVVPLFRNRAAVRPWPKWAALAASFVLGALALQFGTGLRKPASIAERNGQLLASGALEQALSNQLAGSQTGAAPVQIGVSFLSRTGHYCRSFQLREATSMGGLACNEGGNWKLEVLARGEAGPANNPEYRLAGSTLPPAVIQAVNDNIVGDPLDAKSETSARDHQWRETP
jgi:negative regulator of sigma E activity